MANTLTPLEMTILARGVLHLRELAVMPRLVNSDFAPEAAQFGSTIDVKLPKKVTATTVTPGHLPVAPTDAAPEVVPIKLDQWYQSPGFHLTDKDFKEINARRDFLPLQMQEAVISLANNVNEAIHAQYTGIYGFVGTAGTTPFVNAAGNQGPSARKVLQKQLAPPRFRRGVVDFDAEANMLALDVFADVDKVGSTDVKIEGEIGRKYGIDWVADNAVKTHTSTNSPSGWLVNNASVAIGDTTVPIDTGSGDPVAGDIFTVAGDTQTYVVKSYATNTITFAPAAKVAWADSAAITFKATHVVNMAFHRDAFAFAQRPLAAEEGGLGNRIGQVTDPQTGLSLRMEVERQHKQTVWTLDILYGVKLVRPELAVRIAG